MKYDEKTGKKIPESRTDEVKLTIDFLKGLDTKCEGSLSPSIVVSTLLTEIALSTAQLVDIAGTILNKTIQAEKNAEEPVTVKDE